MGHPHHPECLIKGVDRSRNASPILERRNDVGARRRELQEPNDVFEGAVVERPSRPLEAVLPALLTEGILPVTTVGGVPVAG